MPKIAPDKWKHFYVGILMGAVLQIAALYLFPQHRLLGIIITFIFVMAISYGFELFSLVTKTGHYEIWDAVAGTAGGILGMVILLLSAFIFKQI